MSQHVFDKVRVQILHKNIVRIEQMYQNGFCDQNTYFVPSRDCFGGYPSSCQTDEHGNNVVVFDDYKLVVPNGAQTLANVQLYHKDKLVYTYKSISNSGELPVPHKTPAVFALADKPRLLMPANGYTKGARYPLHKGAKDTYLLLCQGNHGLLRQLYVQLTGRTEMVRLSTLGLWNSRYFEHSDESARQLLCDYAKHDVPLDVMVLDTDWRKASDRGIGYEVNTQLFPSIKKFFQFAHNKHVEVCFNDHPEPVAGARNMFSATEIAYRYKNLTNHLKSGLDYWWYDRNWHTKLISPSDGIDAESLGAYVFTDITKSYFQSVASKDIYRRPIILCNADNIANGNYVAIQDSASHRYSTQWTGDIPSDEASIATELNNLMRAQNNCVTYLHPDCGGHTGNPTKEEYIRWMQFGAFLPIYRPHCTKDVVRFREPWVYDQQTLDICRQFIKMRYRLMPVWYKNAYESYLKGMPLLRPMEFCDVTDKCTYNITDQYMLGDNILVAPMHGVAPLRVAPKSYLAPVSATYYQGVDFQGEPIYQTEYKTLQNYFNHTAPAPQVPVYNYSAVFKTKLCFDKDVELIVEADDGVTVLVDGVVTLKDDNYHSACKMKAGTLKANKHYDVEIRYFQGGGEASIALFYNPIHSGCNLVERSVYLPQGQWIDAFTGAQCAHGTRKVVCNYNAMPLYIRKGAVIPILESAQTTAELDWSNVTLDWYPSKETNVCDYIYEDDHETTAYKLGHVRTSAFETSYDSPNNTLQLTLHPSCGSFDDGMTSRQIRVKYHLLGGTSAIKKVLVNGKAVDYSVTMADKLDYPLSTKADCTSNTLQFSFQHPLQSTTVVQVVLK